MNNPQRGGSVSDLFCAATVATTREDGKTIQRHALRCRGCFATVTARDDFGVIDMPHTLPCRVQDFIVRWKHEGNSAAVVDQYDAARAALDPEYREISGAIAEAEEPGGSLGNDPQEREE